MVRHVFVDLPCRQKQIGGRRSLINKAKVFSKAGARSESRAVYVTAWVIFVCHLNELKNVLEDRVEKANFADLFKRDEIPFELFQNDFERIVIPAHPEIGEIKDSLLHNGARYASLSGSGSTVYGIFSSTDFDRKIEKDFSVSYHTVLTKPKI